MENYLRPQFRKAMVHIIKMSSHFFWNQSNVYGLFGLDFMLDEDFNLWFIETNPNPQLLAPTEVFDKVTQKAIMSLFEIQYGLYKSRMKRVLNVILKLKQQHKAGKINLEQLRKEYREAVKNRFEPEYQISKSNTFDIVMDESIHGPGGYFGNIAPECVNI